MYKCAPLGFKTIPLQALSGFQATAQESVEPAGGTILNLSAIAGVFQLQLANDAYRVMEMKRHARLQNRQKAIGNLEISKISDISAVEPRMSNA